MTDEEAELERLCVEFGRAIATARKYEWGASRCVEAGHKMESMFGELSSDEKDKKALEWVIAEIKADKIRFRDQVTLSWPVLAVSQSVQVLKMRELGKKLCPELLMRSDALVIWSRNCAADAVYTEGLLAVPPVDSSGRVVSYSSSLR